MSLGENIARLRRKKGLTQAELGDILCISNQAVSKWENGITMPDVMLLPALADVFDCHIDELFSREVKTEIHYDYCAELPWNDDDVIHLVVCRGKKILEVSDEDVKDVTFKIAGDTLQVTSDANVVIEGNVTGGCVCQGNLSVGGSITGECVAQGNIEAKEWILGECTANGNIVVGGNITGECTASTIVTSEEMN